MRKKTKKFSKFEIFSQFFLLIGWQMLNMVVRLRAVFWMIFQNVFFQDDVQLWRHGMVWLGWCG